MDAYPITVFKRSNRPFYYVSYKNANGKFLSPVSTKKTTEKEAMQVAFDWLRDGIPKKKEALKVQDLSLRDVAKKVKTESEAETLLNEMKLVGWIKSYVLSKSPAVQDFALFLSEFWDWDKSAYIAEKRRKNRGKHRAHCTRQGQAATLYWEPFFEGRILGDITSADVDAFFNHMGSLPLSTERKNSVILAGTKPLRWAFSKGKIKTDPTRGHILFSGGERKRDILTPTAAAAAFRVTWKDERAKIANMLASVTGIRSGVILALRFQHIGSDCIYIRGSWNRADKIKLPKNNETRTVEMPFPDLIQGLVEQAKQNPWGASPDSFVFWTENKNDVPMCDHIFVEGLRKALLNIGFTEKESAKYMSHGWRHFFTSYMIRKLDKKLLKGETVHKTDIMVARYSDHELAGDRETIQFTKKEIFAGLLPETENTAINSNVIKTQNSQQALLLEYKGDPETTAA
jgi:integrase